MTANAFNSLSLYIIACRLRCLSFHEKHSLYHVFYFHNGVCWGIVIPMKRMGEMQHFGKSNRKLPFFFFSVIDAPLSTVTVPTEIPDPQCKFFPKYHINSFLMLVLCLKHILWFQNPL